MPHPFVLLSLAFCLSAPVWPPAIAPMLSDDISVIQLPPLRDTTAWWSEVKQQKSPHAAVAVVGARALFDDIMMPLAESH